MIVSLENFVTNKLKKLCKKRNNLTVLAAYSDEEMTVFIKIDDYGTWKKEDRLFFTRDFILEFTDQFPLHRLRFIDKSKKVNFDYVFFEKNPDLRDIGKHFIEIGSSIYLSFQKGNNESYNFNSILETIQEQSHIGSFNWEDLPPIPSSFILTCLNPNMDAERFIYIDYTDRFEPSSLTDESDDFSYLAA